MGRIKRLTREGEEGVTTGPRHREASMEAFGVEWGGLASCQREQEGAGPRLRARGSGSVRGSSW